MKTFRIIDGRQVRALRAILGLTQAQLGEAAGVNRNSVLRIEGLARVSPRSSVAERLGRFGVEKGVLCEAIDGRPVITIGDG